MKRWLCALLTGALLVGCTQNTAGLRIDGATQTVHFGDSALDDRFHVVDISTQQRHGHTQGAVQLESQYSGDQAIQYRFSWYDNNGVEVNLQRGAWQQMVVRGLETVTLSAMSINPNGTQFQVQIREVEE